jgi:two-component system, LuxR family, response regulator FixJ
MKDISFGATAIASPPQSTIYIVEDDEGLRKSLHWLVATLGVPVKAFQSAEAFLGEYDEQVPGCLVVDVKMPGMSGLNLQRELRRRHDEVPVIVLTGYGSVPTVVEALKQGATEFLEKPYDDTILLEAIQRSLSSDARRRAAQREHRAVCERMQRLTLREREVLGLVVDGLTSKEIAARLRLSFKTVEAHRAKITTKMGVQTVAELVRIVVTAKCYPGTGGMPCLTAVPFD